MTTKPDTPNLAMTATLSGFRAALLFGIFLILPQFFGILNLSGKSIVGSYILLVGVLFLFIIHAIMALLSLVAIALKTYVERKQEVEG